MSKSTAFYVFKALEAIPFSGMRVIIIAAIMVVGFIAYGIFTHDYASAAQGVGTGLAFIFTRESIRKNEMSATYIKAMLEGLSAAEPILPRVVSDVVKAEADASEDFNNG